jgi:hypothetical protein
MFRIPGQVKKGKARLIEWERPVRSTFAAALGT